MSWTDYSNTTADLYGFGETESSTDVFLASDGEPFVLDGIFVVNSQAIEVNNLFESYNILGFEDGYQPNYVPNPITGNIDEPDPNGGGGGSTRPATGMLYPRGQG